jgi:hypothetical protein
MAHMEQDPAAAEEETFRPVAGLEQTYELGSRGSVRSKKNKTPLSVREGRVLLRAAVASLRCAARGDHLDPKAWDSSDEIMEGSPDRRSRDQSPPSSSNAMRPPPSQSAPLFGPGPGPTYRRWKAWWWRWLIWALLGAVVPALAILAATCYAAAEGDGCLSHA